MANLERKTRGAVTNEALSVISAEYEPKHKVVLSSDSTPTAVRLSYPNFWVNIQPDKDVYYSWSRRTPDSLFSSVQSQITFEDNTVNGFVNGGGAYPLASVGVDANSILEGTYSFLGTDAAGVTNTHRFNHNVAVTFVTGNKYVFRFYSKGLLLGSADYVNLVMYAGEASTGVQGAAIAGSWEAISGRTVSGIPRIDGNSGSWYEFVFEPTVNATGYLHFIYQNGSGVSMRCYVDDYEIWSIPTSDYIPITALDQETANYLYGDTEYERRIRWGVADDRSQDDLFLILERKISAVTTVKISEG